VDASSAVEGGVISGDTGEKRQDKRAILRKNRGNPVKESVENVRGRIIRRRALILEVKKVATGQDDAVSKGKKRGEEGLDEPGP